MKSLPLSSFLTLLTALSISLSGCSKPDPIAEARKPLSVIFDAMKRSDVEGALMLYAPSFFKSTSRQDWLRQLATIHQQLGPVTGFEVLEEITEEKDEPIPGTYVQFQCRVNYQRGALIETLVFVRPKGLQHFTVSGHGITATPAQAALNTTQPQPQAQPSPPAPGAPVAAPQPSQPAPNQQALPPATTPPPPAAPPTPAPQTQGALPAIPQPVAPAPPQPVPAETPPAPTQ